MQADVLYVLDCDKRSVFGRLIKALRGVPDPRRRRHVQHSFTDILAIAICAVIANCDSWGDIAQFANAREEWFRSFLSLKNGIPTRDTFRRVISQIKPQVFQQVLIEWIIELHQSFQEDKDRHIAIDGKTLRKSFDRAAAKSPLHLVQAMCAKSYMTLSQVPTEDKSNEITAIPKVLDSLEIEGALLSLDAMGCQKEIAEQIIQGKGGYLLALKDNHPTLREEVGKHFEQLHSKKLPKSVRTCEVIEKRARGRSEERTYTMAPIPKQMTSCRQWAGLKTFLQATTVIEAKDKPTTIETRYFLSSLDVKEFDRAVSCVRRHWRIESAHWILDMSFKEDECRIRKDHGPENFAWLRRIALSLAKAHQKTLEKNGKKYPPSLRWLRKEAAISTDTLATMLLQRT